MAQETYTGTVSWFSVTKGYGVCLQSCRWSLCRTRVPPSLCIFVVLPPGCASLTRTRRLVRFHRP
jgi:hypothetical protein